MRYVMPSMIRLLPPKSKVKFYGEIIRARPLVDLGQRIGYRIIIRTPIKAEYRGELCPIYVRVEDTSMNQKLFKWWKRYRCLYNEWQREYTNWQRLNPRNNLSDLEYAKLFNQWLANTNLIPIMSQYAPVLIKGTKTGDTAYANTQLRNFDSATYIIWEFLNVKYQLDPQKTIPEEYRNIELFVSDTDAMFQAKIRDILI